MNKCGYVLKVGSTHIILDIHNHFKREKDKKKRTVIPIEDLEL